MTLYNMLYCHLRIDLMTIKDFNGSKGKKGDDTKQREKDQIMLAEKNGPVERL